MPAAPAAPVQPPRDHVRETFETLVFVVVLVLILQLFVLEAFVIPTGSMAETQYGYHKVCTCQQCKFQFPVNAAREVEERVKMAVYTCPNCQFAGDVDWNGPVGIESGDRVLVHKAMSPDERGRIVVFKYPMAPQKKQQAQNYIKRCVGFGEDTVALYQGDLYHHRGLKYDGLPRPTDERESWQMPYAYPNEKSAVTAFADSQKKGFPAGAGGFELWRKPDDLVMDMRRIVFDNDFQPADLGARGVAPRWAGRDNEAAGWTADDPKGPKVFTHAGDTLGWIGYQHRVVSTKVEVREVVPAELVADKRFPLAQITSIRNLPAADAAPVRITNAMGYNGDGAGSDWVSDLMLECTAKTEAGSELTMELSKGQHRFQATFADGKVTLVRTGPGNWPPVSRPTPMTKPGTYALRFANVDCRLRVWVNDTPVDFGAEADFSPPTDGLKEVKANDIDAPAGIAAKGAVVVSGLKLWRDTHYTWQKTVESRTLVAEYYEETPLAKELNTYFVQPDHFLCLGDNSSSSSDGRTWGLVPKRLMIGRAVFTFWPRSRIGPIR